MSDYICDDCPRACHAMRRADGAVGDGAGRCRMGANPVVALTMTHRWEEPCISGSRGSGAIFFAGCPLGCAYCQNAIISGGGASSTASGARSTSPGQLAEIFAELSRRGAHNINLVTPTHFARGISRALKIARVRLDIPVIYNTSGYESVKTLRALDGLIDVYLPDMKYSDPAVSAALSDAPDYPEVAAAAILEMLRQTGTARYDGDGIMTRGVLVRHLVLPGYTSNSLGVVDWIADNLPRETPVSLMAQYTPPTKNLINAAAPSRKLTAREFAKVEARLFARGIDNGYVQSALSADAAYIPDFMAAPRPRI